MVKNLPAKQETQVQSLGQEDHLEKEMSTTTVYLPGKSLGQGRLESYSPWGHRRVRYNLAAKQTKQNISSLEKSLYKSFLHS